MLPALISVASALIIMGLTFRNAERSALSEVQRSELASTLNRIRDGLQEISAVSAEGALPSDDGDDEDSQLNVFDESFSSLISSLLARSAASYTVARSLRLDLSIGRRDLVDECLYTVSELMNSEYQIAHDAVEQDPTASSISLPDDDLLKMEAMSIAIVKHLEDEYEAIRNQLLGVDQ